MSEWLWYVRAAYGVAFILLLIGIFLTGQQAKKRIKTKAYLASKVSSRGA